MAADGHVIAVETVSTSPMGTLANVVDPTSVQRFGVTSVETGDQYTVAVTLAAADPPRLRTRT